MEEVPAAFISEESYEVERIVDIREKEGGRGELEFLIRWRGFGQDDDSWEPIANLGEGCERLIQQYYNEASSSDDGDEADQMIGEATNSSVAADSKADALSSAVDDGAESSASLTDRSELLKDPFWHRLEHMDDGEKVAMLDTVRRTRRSAAIAAGAAVRSTTTVSARGRGKPARQAAASSAAPAAAATATKQPRRGRGRPPKQRAPAAQPAADSSAVGYPASDEVPKEPDEVVVPTCGSLIPEVVADVEEPPVAAASESVANVAETVSLVVESVALAEAPPDLIAGDSAVPLWSVAQLAPRVSDGEEVGGLKEPAAAPSAAPDDQSVLKNWKRPSRWENRATAAEPSVSPAALPTADVESKQSTSAASSAGALVESVNPREQMVAAAAARLPLSVSSVSVSQYVRSRQRSDQKARSVPIDQRRFERACLTGEVDVVQSGCRLLERSSSAALAVDASDEAGAPLLTRVCARPCDAAHALDDVIECLVRAGAPINAQHRQTKKAPLHAAVEMGALCHVWRLTQMGCAVNIPDASGLTPLMLAAQLSHVQIVRHLLECGADFNATAVIGKGSSGGATVSTGRSADGGAQTPIDMTRDKRTHDVLKEFVDPVESAFVDAVNSVLVGFKIRRKVFPLHCYGAWESPSSLFLIHFPYTDSVLPNGRFGFVLAVAVAKFHDAQVTARLWGACPVRAAELNDEPLLPLQDEGRFLFICQPRDGQNSLVLHADDRAKCSQMKILVQLFLVKLNKPPMAVSIAPNPRSLYGHVPPNPYD